jgi:hypothetical protein
MTSVASPCERDLSSPRPRPRKLMRRFALPSPSSTYSLCLSSPSPFFFHPFPTLVFPYLLFLASPPSLQVLLPASPLSHLCIASSPSPYPSFLHL